MASFLSLLFCFFLGCALSKELERACTSESCASDAEEATFLQFSQGEHLKTENSMDPLCLSLPCKKAEGHCLAKGQCCDFAKYCKSSAAISYESREATSCYAISCETARDYCWNAKPHGRCCDVAHVCRSKNTTRNTTSMAQSVSAAAKTTNAAAQAPAVGGLFAAIFGLMSYNYYLQIKDYSILTNVGDTFSHTHPGFIQNWDAIVSDNGKYGMLINDCSLYGVIFGDDGFGNNYGQMDIAFKSTACYFEAKSNGEICGYNSSVHFSSGSCDTVWLESGNVSSPILKVEDTGELCTYEGNTNSYNNKGCSKTFEELHDIFNQEQKQAMTVLLVDAAASSR